MIFFIPNKPISYRHRILPLIILVSLPFMMVSCIFGLNTKANSLNPEIRNITGEDISKNSDFIPNTPTKEETEDEEGNDDEIENEEEEELDKEDGCQVECDPEL